MSGNSNIFIKGRRQKQKEQFSSGRMCTIVVTLCLVLSSIFITQAGATPVIVEDENNGSWTDHFDDSTGVSSSSNVTIENGDVKLSPEGIPSVINWDHEYTADVEPEAVGWTISENAVGDLANASGGVLLLDTTPENAWWWYTYSWGASNSVGATFEARLKVESSNFGIKVFVRDGTYWEGIVIFPDRIMLFSDTFNVYFMDTTDSYHTYRFTVKNNDYMIYVDDVLRINGTGQHNVGTGSNVCSFGDTDDIPPGYDGKSEWDYVRFNVSGAFPPLPYGYNLNGSITSTEISLPSGLSWNSLFINKTEPGSENSINVSVLDGATNQPIQGYENLTNTDIDISGIDPVTHPTIRLKAHFVGNGSSTPVLHNWKVTWLDTIPPTTPSGLNINNPYTGFSLILNWDYNFDSDFENYIVYCSTDNVTFYWLANFSVETTSYIHYGLIAGVTYYYKIAAADDVPNQSPFSYVVEGVPDLDYDGDNIGDIDDPDDDNDGIPDFSDPYPLNPLNDIESTIDYMNMTIEDVQTRVIIIQTILENLNLTELVNILNYLNQTLPPKIDDLSTQLTSVNDSLMGRVTDAETNILSEIAIVDASLSNEIQNALVSITNDIIDMNSSLSDELTTLLNTMTTEHDGLQQWLELVLGLIDSNLTTTNDTLHSQLDYLDQSITNFYNNLEDDIGDVSSDLQLHDQTTGQNHSDIIGLLGELLDGQIEKEQIDDLKTRLINLANDLSGHNQTIADDIMDVVNDIDAFEDNINQQLLDINNTLDQLARSLQPWMNHLSRLKKTYRILSMTDQLEMRMRNTFS
jgi:hypothetical protein